MHLGATELFHSVTPTGSGYIYPQAKFWKFLRTVSLVLSPLCLLGLRIFLLAASCLPPLVSTAVNGSHLRRCHRSKSIAELGYGLGLCAILNSKSLAHCVSINLAMIEIILFVENTL